MIWKSRTKQKNNELGLGLVAEMNLVELGLVAMMNLVEHGQVADICRAMEHRLVANL